MSSTLHLPICETPFNSLSICLGRYGSSKYFHLVKSLSWNFTASTAWSILSLLLRSILGIDHVLTKTSGGGHNGRAHASLLGPISSTRFTMALSVSDSLVSHQKLESCVRFLTLAASATAWAGPARRERSETMAYSRHRYQRNTAAFPALLRGKKDAVVILHGDGHVSAVRLDHILNALELPCCRLQTYCSVRNLCFGS